MANKRLKIVFLNITQNAVHRGGETLVQNLAKELSINHDVDILAGGQHMPVRWPFLWRLFIDLNGIKVAIFTLKSIPQLLNKKYDVIIPINGGWQALIIRVFTLIFGGKMIVSAQSGVGWDDRINLWCFPDGCILPSSRAYRWAQKVNPFVKKWFIQNGVDLKNFSPNGKAYKTNLKGKIVICVGALVPQKRIDLVIKAVAKVKNVSLLIVGRGEAKEKLTNLADKLLKGRYEIVNFPHQQMPELYRCADLFTLVSTPTEAFGLVFVEALASNLPVIAIDDEQRKEIIEDAGDYVNPHDSTQYAKTIEQTLNKKWGQIPRKQAEKFSWSKVSDSYEKVFFEVLQ